jgi:hypothetical protein
VIDRQPDPALGSTVMALAFSPDGGLLATGHRDGTVALWQRSDTGLSLLHRVPRGHAGRVWAIAVHPDGSQVATGGEDRLIRIWPVSGTGLGEPRTLEGHANEVRAVAFSPDGALLFSGSRDQSVRIHQVTRPDQQPVVIPDLMEWVRTIAISADGTVLAAASDSASIRLIVPGSDDLARLACEAIRREPLSDTEWQRFVGTHEPRRDTCAVITGLPDGAPPVVRDGTRTTITRRRDRPPTSPLHHPTRRHFARGACRDRHPISL